MRHGRLRFIGGFLIIPLVLYTVFMVLPSAQSFQIAFTDWRGVSATANYVGFDNFARVFQSELFWKAMRNHGVLLLVVPLTTIVLAMYFAFLVNIGGRREGGRLHGLRGSAFYRVVFFFPQVLSVAIVGVLFQSVFRPDDAGIVNGLLAPFGVDPIGFLIDPSIALWSIIAVMVWAGVGFYFVLFSAAMAGIPAEVVEAASLDGAGRVRLFFSIIVPMVRDTVQTAWVFLGMAALDAFVLVKVLSVNNGGPDGATTMVPVQVYGKAFNEYQFGQASAAAVVLFFIIMTFAALTMRVTRREQLEY
ncbi:sugar ABC transporter permease [Actinoplanes sp. OR16]|uniref:carbohydrate ABC transporter permease n=1 Tax=Actinoplanes sp. OR16 TaxID=946334 RepID=UPI000F6FEF45|nr:sugar ABC transporter permease [Actinoplanes sp. OR16]BBH68435.1 sugar ABC transporter permease [Actinoplanes sp. OR16]